MQLSHLRPLACLIFAALPVVDAAPEFVPSPPPAIITVGGREITVPPPTGLVRCDGIFAEWDQIMQSFIPATNRLLATYGTPDDLASIQRKDAPDYSTNCHLQTPRSSENQDIGERTFGDVHVQLKDELDKALVDIGHKIDQVVEKGNQTIKRNFGVEDALAVSDTAMLGYFEDTSTALGFTMAVKTTNKAADGAVESSRSVVAALVTPVNGRLLLFYATVPFTTEADRPLAEHKVASWRDAVVAANPRFGGPRANRGFLDGSKLSRSAIIGGIAGAVGGGLAGLIVMLKKRRKS